MLRFLWIVSELSALYTVLDDELAELVLSPLAEIIAEEQRYVRLDYSREASANANRVRYSKMLESIQILAKILTPRYERRPARLPPSRWRSEVLGCK